MTTTITRQAARPKTSAIEMIWFNGRNAIEVAKFLQEHGKRPDVGFHDFGETLSLHGHRIEPEKEHDGIWVLADGRRVSKDVIAKDWEVVESR